MIGDEVDMPFDFIWSTIFCGNPFSAFGAISSIEPLQPARKRAATRKPAPLMREFIVLCILVRKSRITAGRDSSSRLRQLTFKNHYCRASQPLLATAH